MKGNNQTTLQIQIVLMKLTIKNKIKNVKIAHSHQVKIRLIYFYNTLNKKKVEM
jgi:hypothetical protein